MKIYNVIVEDRHSDVDAYPFTDKETAIKVARAIAEKLCRFKEDLQEVEVEGWVINIRYSCEGDSVRVVEYETDNTDGKLNWFFEK